MIKSVKILLFVFLSCTISCTITQEIIFEEDFSGTYSFIYDFTEYTSIFNSEEDFDSLMVFQKDFELYLKQLEKKVKDINGISNIVVINDADKGVVFLSFKFDGVESLNKSLEATSVFSINEDYVPPRFEQNRRKLTYHRKAYDISSHEDTEINMDIFQAKFIVKFMEEPRSIELCDSIHTKIEKSIIREEGNIYELSNKNTTWEINFKRNWFRF